MNHYNIRGDSITLQFHPVAGHFQDVRYALVYQANPHLAKCVAFVDSWRRGRRAASTAPPSPPRQSFARPSISLSEPGQSLRFAPEFHCPTQIRAAP